MKNDILIPCTITRPVFNTYEDDGVEFIINTVQSIDDEFKKIVSEIDMSYHEDKYKEDMLFHNEADVLRSILKMKHGKEIVLSYAFATGIQYDSKTEVELDEESISNIKMEYYDRYHWFVICPDGRACTVMESSLYYDIGVDPDTYPNWKLYDERSDRRNKKSKKFKFVYDTPAHVMKYDRFLRIYCNTYIDSEGKYMYDINSRINYCESLVVTHTPKLVVKKEISDCSDVLNNDERGPADRPDLKYTYCAKYSDVEWDYMRENNMLPEYNLLEPDEYEMSIRPKPLFETFEELRYLNFASYNLLERYGAYMEVNQFYRRNSYSDLFGDNTYVFLGTMRL